MRTDLKQPPMKLSSKIFITLAALAAPLATFAVTPEEMEQARVITAQAYLRYANNGSGYLDDLKPKTMDELISKLKKKEVENLKSFAAVKVPADFAAWDKERLVKYWGTEFFNQPGLLEDGKKARSRVKSRVGALTIAAPAPDAEASAAKETPTAETTPEAPVSLSDPDQAAPAETMAEAADSTAAAVADEIAAEQELEDVKAKKSDSSTWIYVAILAVLVGVVVWLVVFASNSMKRQGASPRAVTDGNNGNADSGTNHRLAAALSDKNTEIDSLNERIENLEHDLKDARVNCAALSREKEALETRLKDMEARLAAANAAAASVQRQPEPRIQETAAPAAVRPRPIRTIYLARANSHGVFVRADREFNVGNTVFRLTTPDGISGSFEVVDDPTVCEIALINPEDSLVTACTGHDLLDTHGKTRIINESPGTAIFEGGRWRVARKARIAYK